MYKEIFKNGINEESLEKAGEYAVERVMETVNFKEEIRRTAVYFNPIMWVEKDENKFKKYFYGIDPYCKEGKGSLFVTKKGVLTSKKY
ncbi:hypothetical protein [Tenacibaculum sp. 190524A02b]|uniref:hypothetical protein n=1 Tax=Tenacibaculum vairaonense TaxID=3137860 RepID=UPI0031FB13B3